MGGVRKTAMPPPPTLLYSQEPNNGVSDAERHCEGRQQQANWREHLFFIKNCLVVILSDFLSISFSISFLLRWWCLWPSDLLPPTSDGPTTVSAAVKEEQIGTFLQKWSKKKGKSP